ncbi:MAG: type II toxin-antitoxin system RelE/ParE family toxin [Ilumatobacteraceae bacterium]
MTTTRLRPLAEADLVERTRHYRREGGDQLAERFFGAALAALGRMPGAGSPRLGEMCGIPGLRFRSVADFPCGWFSFVTDDHVDVVRLLAEAQDLPTLLGDSDHRP